MPSRRPVGAARGKPDRPDRAAIRVRAATSGHIHGPSQARYDRLCCRCQPILPLGGRDKRGGYGAVPPRKHTESTEVETGTNSLRQDRRHACAGLTGITGTGGRRSSVSFCDAFRVFRVFPWLNFCLVFVCAYRRTPQGTPQGVLKRRVLRRIHWRLIRS